MLFSEFKIKPGLIKALEQMWYTLATDIQQQVIKPALEGKNIVGQSQTWTGKTTAFLLPILQRIDTNKKWLQALILAPTRELVNQIGEEIFKLTAFYRVNAVCVYGWASLEVQKTKLKRDPSIIVATPGRLMDFINQKVINLSPAEFFVLDEVDRMLDMWFIRDIKKIRAQLKNVKQTYTFSATISEEIKKVIKEHIPTYESIKVWDITVAKIHHSYMQIEHEEKLINVKKLLDYHYKEKILIFTQTKRNTKSISTALAADGYKIAMLNGDMSQWKRMSTLTSFKQWNTRILITTDVAARWLNMDNVGLVINFDVPNDTESYIHRIGRTWRAGATWKAIILVSDKEIPLVKNIEKTHRIRIERSEHDIIRDDKNKFSHIRLDRSTDKKWGKQTQSRTTWVGSRRPERPRFGGKPSFGRNDRKPERSKFWDKPRFGSWDKKPERRREKPKFGSKPKFDDWEKTLDRKSEKPRFGGKSSFGRNDRKTEGSKFEKKPFSARNDRKPDGYKSREWQSRPSTNRPQRPQSSFKK